MKFILILTGVIIFILYTVPMIRAKINLGNMFGIFTSLLLILSGTFYEKILTATQSRIVVIFLVLFYGAVAILYTLFFITLTKIIICPLKQEAHGDSVIVLGCRVKGTVPTKALLSRCDAAYKYLIKNKNAVAILSGGQGSDEEISEAECMKRILLSRGIEQSRLYTECHSTSTMENLMYSKEIIEENNLSNEVIICTSEYHIYRALILAEPLKINAGAIAGHSMRVLRIPAFTREVFGIWYIKLKGIFNKKSRDAK